MHKEVSISDIDADLDADLVEEFDWITYNRFHRGYPGASYVVGSPGFAPITRDEAMLPAKGTREYRAFKRWQQGSLFSRFVDFVFTKFKPSRST